MTSPSLISESVPASSAPAPESPPAIRLPLLLFLVTLFSTTSVGMRYMYDFSLNRSPLRSEADLLPFAWVFHHLPSLASGLPFSLTLIAILLAHEFGHFFACQAFGVRATLPYLLPAPSLSGSFGAVIRLQSRVRSRSALIVIGAMGPVCGFLVALATITVGLSLSHHAPDALPPPVQAPLLIQLLHALLAPNQSILHLIPHPMLTASWMGLLITALNLIPAGQLDGGHILYAISPAAHRICSRLVVAMLLALGVFCWSGWIVWGLILLSPGMRHPIVPPVGVTDQPVKPWHLALIPLCAILLILSFTYTPFQGYSLLDFLHKLHTP